MRSVSTRSHPGLIAIMSDRSRTPEERITTLAQLESLGDPESVSALLAVAADETESDVILTAVGAALGRVYMRQDRLLDAALHNFAGTAYLAFDQAVSDAQNSD